MLKKTITFLKSIIKKSSPLPTPTYEEQWQKITSAYLNSELDPYVASCCFSGNLLNNSTDWIKGRGFEYGKVINCKSFYNIAKKSIKEHSNGLYSVQDIIDLEYNFMETINVKTTNSIFLGNSGQMEHSNYENALFDSMVSTLELLKEIHIKKGEKGLKELIFKKRTIEKELI